MNLEGNMLSDMSQRQIYDFTYMWILKQNKQNRNLLINIEGRLMVARWPGGWGPG